MQRECAIRWVTLSHDFNASLSGDYDDDDDDDDDNNNNNGLMGRLSCPGLKVNPWHGT